MGFLDLLTEAPLNRAELVKYGGQRGITFREKILKGAKFKLVDGSEVIIPNTKENLEIFDNMINTPKATAVFTLADGSKLKINELQKTSEFGGVGAKKLTGADWEKVIIVAYNMKNHGMTEGEAVITGEIQGWTDKYSSSLETGFKIVDHIKEKSAKMKHYGLASAELTQGWEKYFIQMTGKSASSSTKTPKTDFYLTNGMNISLKKAGGSQLMSGGQPEALATLMFAYENTPDSVKDSIFKSQFENLTQEIVDHFVKIPNISITSIKKDIKAGKKSEMISYVQGVLEKNTDMRNSLVDLTNISEFKEAIVREAMTGENKFADKLPKSSHIMVFDETGNASLKIIDDTLVKKYASKTRFDISMKTAQGRSWVAMKGIVGESYENIIETSLIETLHEVENGEPLTEKFTDSLKSGLEKVKSFLFTFVKKWIIKVLSIIKRNLSVLLGLMKATFTVKDPTILYTV